MKFNQITMVGRFNVEVKASLPSFDSNRDKGRIVHSEEDDKIFFGTGTGWQEVSTDADLSSHISTDVPNAHNTGTIANQNKNNVEITGGTATLSSLTASDVTVSNNLNVTGTNNIMPAGTRMIFRQNFAPAGWTFLAEDNDRVFLNTSTESEGGDRGGNWTISGFYGSTNNHTLSISEMPRHRHRIKGNDGAHVSYQESAPYLRNDDAERWAEDVGSMNYVGGSQGHSHSIGDSNFKQNGNWRPSYVKVITCEKD